MIMQKSTVTPATLKKNTWYSGWGRELKKNKLLYLLILPAIIYVFIFSYIPMGGIIIAFKDYKFNLGIFKSPWVGFDNFKFLISSGKLWNLTVNTLSYNITFRIVGTIAEMFMAIMITEMATKYYKRAVQSVMMLPHFLSWVIIGGMAYSLLNYEFGTINNVLASLGFERIDVYSNPTAWRVIFPLTYLWHGCGYGMIYYLAAVTGINTELYEAAYLDGCGLLKRIRHVTLPLILPTTCILTLLNLGSVLKGNMDMFYQLVGNNANLYNATDVIDTYVFRTLTQLKDYAVTSASGLYQNVLGCILVLTVNWIVGKIDKDSAIF